MDRAGRAACVGDRAAAARAQCAHLAINKTLVPNTTACAEWFCNQVVLGAQTGAVQHEKELQKHHVDLAQAREGLHLGCVNMQLTSAKHERSVNMPETRAPSSNFDQSIRLGALRAVDASTAACAHHVACGMRDIFAQFVSVRAIHSADAQQAGCRNNQYQHMRTYTCHTHVRIYTSLRYIITT